MRIVEFDEIDSTNLEAKRMAEAGDFGPLWISAKCQSLGKGRRGREWISKTGNLYCTGLFSHSGTVATAAQLSFAAALAVHDTISYFRPDVDTKIKWPNDVLMNGAKVAGILLDSGTLDSGTGDNQLWVAVGIGINLGSAPEDTPYPATFLLSDMPQAKRPLTTVVKSKLFVQFECWMDTHDRNGFEPLRVAWLDRAQSIGEPVTAHLPNKTIEGKAMGMDADGALVIKIHSGAVVKIHAGDVYFS